MEGEYFILIEQPNMQIRKECRRYGIPLWMLAQKAGISEQTLIRWLREELTDERRTHLISIIEELRKEVLA